MMTIARQLSFPLYIPRIGKTNQTVPIRLDGECHRIRHVIVQNAVHMLEREWVIKHSPVGVDVKTRRCWKEGIVPPVSQR